jgi:hypothetical protein
MSQSGENNLLRSIGAVLAGLVAIFVLSIGTDIMLHAAGVFPPLGQPFSDRLCLIATAYRAVYAVIGCYITARLAPNRPMKPAIICGFVGVVLSTAGAVATWNGGPAYGPHWYPIALILISLPCAWVGGKLVRERTVA